MLRILPHLAAPPIGMSNHSSSHLGSASGWRDCARCALLPLAFALAVAGVDDITRADAQTARLQGSVTTDLGVPLPNVEIALLESSQVRTLSGARGQFDLQGIPPGTHSVVVRLIGYATQRFSVAFAPGGVEVLHASLAVDALPIPAVEVTGQTTSARSVGGFFQRRERGLGFFLTGEEIAQLQARSLTDVLRRVPGAGIGGPQGNFGQRRGVQMGRGTGISGGQNCEAAFYVNGQPFPVSATDQGIDAYVRPADVAGLEVYSGASTIPPQFASATNSRCGAIVIWTWNGPNL